MRKRITRKKKQQTSSTFKIVLIAILLVMLSPFYYGHVVRIASTVWFKIKHASDSENYKTYRSFNIKIPKNYTIHGIDVSYYQGKIDWQKVVAMKEEDVRISFAFIKATEGLVLADPCFRRNWREAAKAGLSVGAYHFFRPRKSGLWQANFFLQNISIEKGHLPPVVDVESLDGVSAEQMREELKAFILQIEAKTKVKPIIYTGL